MRHVTLPTARTVPPTTEKCDLCNFLLAVAPVRWYDSLTMKDCSTCQYRVDLHPEYAEMDFEDTPCCGCKPSEPETMNGRRVSIRGQWENPNAKTWQPEDPGEEECHLMGFLFWLQAWERLSP